MERISVDRTFSQKAALRIVRQCVVAGLVLVSLQVSFELQAQINLGEWLPDEALSDPFNIEMPTLGGTQFWSDVKIVDGWKIQRNCNTDHYRLIDGRDMRRTWGSREQCEEILNEKIAGGTVRPYQGRVVILLHGLLRSSDSMETLENYLRKHGNYQTIAFTYASSREAISQHAVDLKSVIDGLGTDVTEIHFVAHSMGNIVVRHYLKDLETASTTTTKTDPRFKRMVMLAPPNQGSKMARRLGKSTALFPKLAGQSGMQLGVGWKQLEPHLATPSFEFGIIAGAKDPDDDGGGLQPIDFTVSPNETVLHGAADTFEGPFFHWDVIKNPLALQKTLHFLQHGRFEKW